MILEEQTETAILSREPLLDGRHADNLGYLNSVDEAHKLIYIHRCIYIYIYIDIALWHYKAFLSLLCILTSLFSSSPLAWLG